VYFSKSIEKIQILDKNCVFGFICRWISWLAEQLVAYKEGLIQMLGFRFKEPPVIHGSSHMWQRMLHLFWCYCTTCCLVPVYHQHRSRGSVPNPGPVCPPSGHPHPLLGVRWVFKSLPHSPSPHNIPSRLKESSNYIWGYFSCFCLFLSFFIFASRPSLFLFFTLLAFSFCEREGQFHTIRFKAPQKKEMDHK
jgi:hypothetical protein